jgi:hypothetical protein
VSEIALDHENGAWDPLGLRVLGLESSHQVGRNRSKGDAIESVKRTVGHVINDIHDVIVRDELSNDMRTDKSASTRDKGTIVIHFYLLKK